MANPNGAGAKFVSVNLNKSYGQPSHHYPPYNSSYGQGFSNRVRTGGHGVGGGSGMVVLSRPRSSQKVGAKLSVPPPLNLPSLRKEHERFDLSGSGAGSATGSGTGSGARPTSSGMGWSKPGGVALQEKDGTADAFGRSGVDTQTVHVADQTLHTVDGVARGSRAYMPPSARVGGVAFPEPASPYQPQAEKAAVLRGEDFPSLKAALPVTSGLSQKQKDSLSQKPKHVAGEEPSDDQKDISLSSSLVHMRPQGQNSHHTVSNSFKEKGGEDHGLGSTQMWGKVQKHEEYFPGPLPLVRVNPRSDWADDERDTGPAFAPRGREHEYRKNEAYWDDMPTNSVLPNRPPHNLSERWAQRDNETSKSFSSEVAKMDPYRRDIARTPSKEGNIWRSDALSKDRNNAREIVSEKNAHGAGPTSLSRESEKEGKYIPPAYGENVGNGGVAGYQDSAFGRREMSHGQGGKQHLNRALESFHSRGPERSTQERYGSEQSYRSRVDSFQNKLPSKPLVSSGGKAFYAKDLSRNFGGEKHSFSRSERSYLEDPFLKDFGATSLDERDPFSGNLIAVVKRKKDAAKQADFNDPIRDSFEAELERVQRLQELERQRVIDEQEKAIMQARREEEERQRLIREEEERQRRVEDEAREAAWKAEQERLEAVRRAEEQKIAREEEKRRLLLEEERRKHAAKQKLLELEARIAKRHAEASKDDGYTDVPDDSEKLIKKDVYGATDLDSWEDNERIVERLTTSASSDSSSLNRPSEISSRPQPLSDGFSGFQDRGNNNNSWRRDASETRNSSSFFIQEQGNGYHSPRRDASIGGRASPRKELFGGDGYMSSRTNIKGGMHSLQMDDFPHLKGHRWNPPGDGDIYSASTDFDSKNMAIDLEFDGSLGGKYGDVRLGQDGRSRVTRSYPERLYTDPEADDLYTYGRSRYSVRQPRVLPPPSITPIQRTSFRGEFERPGPSTLIDNDLQYDHATRNESSTGYYGDHQENPGSSEMGNVHLETAISEDHKLDKDSLSRCDSQSSLSVSSPPDSPTPLSHDDLDSGDSPEMSAIEEGKNMPLSGSESVVLNVEPGKSAPITASSSISAGDDEDWVLGHNDELQEQEEYDEDEDAYQEEDEGHEEDGENSDLTQEFKDMHLGEKGSYHLMDNLVLGFDQGVEVGLPTDGFDRNLMKEESTFRVSEVSVGIIDDQRPVDEMLGDGQSFEPLSGPPQVKTDSSSMRMQETKMAIQDTSDNTLNTSMASDLDMVSSSRTSVLPTEHAVSSAVDISSHSSGQTAMSSVPSGLSQGDFPVKLQFGLFSGPPLIPSPVPAIQIGSIQMPLHLHSAVGPTLGHVHPSQPPLFQFGQLRYTSPISQGILPIGAPSMSFVQPNVQANYSLNQKSGGSISLQPSQEAASQNLMKDNVQSLSVDGKPVSGPVDISQKNVSRRFSLVREGAENDALVENSLASKNRVMAEPMSHITNEHGETVSVNKGSAPSQPIMNGKDCGSLNAPGLLGGSRGRKFPYSVRNSGSRSFTQVSDASRQDSNGFQRRSRRTIQRTEFRVRGRLDDKQSSALPSHNNSGLVDESNSNGRGVGIFIRSGSKRNAISNKPPLKQSVESDSLNAGSVGSQETHTERKADKGIGKEAYAKNANISHSGEGNFKMNISPEEDVDAPLQSGIVRVFKQPGIEAPSDEDDFIQVRSKKQMLNDRREQREKEIKAKSRESKAPRRPRSTLQSAVVSSNSNKIPASLGDVPTIHSDFIVSEGRGVTNLKPSSGFPAMVSQPLAPIGTPTVSTAVQADKRSQVMKSSQSGSVSVMPSGGKSLGPGLMFEMKDKVSDNIPTSLSPWDNRRIDKQVMALTQTQLDEAMKPARFDACVASIGESTSSASEPILPSPSIQTKDKTFLCTASPINSLLAGEKIQFGAVTSPTVLPHTSRVVSHGVGAPGSGRSDIQSSHNLSPTDNECTLFAGKDKHSDKSCVHLEEAEAEAAASAVAVAAISNDEVVGNGNAGGQKLDVHLKAEESLSVALPADLSVENPPISMWPPLPSPQDSSGPMLSHFSGGPPSHISYFDMNPVLGGPIFAFGPHDESLGTQSQSQKSTASSLGPIGNWQQCHSGMDSFYGPQSGFTGPFISSPGGIPGVQGPPHMVVYNHFAPVGQFGQVGLGFMGTTYIPSGKQPVWKHSPSSSSMVIGEGEMNSMNMVSAPRNLSSMPAPVPHLPSGSSLLPMASPLAMFDVSPFQPTHDMPVQARWSHVPASPLHSVPMPMPPPQHQQDGVLPPPPKFSGAPLDQSITATRFPESRTSTPSDNSRSFPVATVSQFPDELGLVDPSSAACGSSNQTTFSSSSCVSSITDAAKAAATQSVGATSSNSQGTSTFRVQSSQQRNSGTQQYGHSSGYNYQRGNGLSQKNSSGSDWTQRRMGFNHRRNQSLGADKGFPSKVKQIYVAKQTTGGTSTTG